ncbi:hypothetical protein ISCGN_032199 [Ixodes scapularis]
MMDLANGESPAAEAIPSGSLAAFQIKLPAFWAKNATVWFAQVEAQFQLHHITSQTTKYLHVVSSLPAELADELENILAAPATSNQYDLLKAAILARKTPSERSRLQHLLNMEELGDQRPSQLLRRMRQLMGDVTTDADTSLLRELFLQRLPHSMVPILAAAEDMPLDQLANLADRVEAQFQLHHITSQTTKYLHVVSSLPAELADELENILAAPATSNQYDLLKAAILARKTPSERSRLQHLLNMEELGDQRPSQLLRRMRQLMGDVTTDADTSLLRELFLQRLPHSMVPILAAAEDMPLDQLANLADRVREYSAPTISATSRRSNRVASPPSRSTENNLETRLSRLEQAIQDLQLSRRPRRISRAKNFYPESKQCAMMMANGTAKLVRAVVDAGAINLSKLHYTGHSLGA